MVNGQALEAGVIPAMERALRRFGGLGGFLLFALLANAILFALHAHDALVSEITEFAPKARDLLAFRVPSSNFYPIGDGLLYAPFYALKIPTFGVIVFYFNIGLTFYWLTCQKIGSVFWRRAALGGLCANLYLFVYLVTGEDTAFQFATFGAAAYCMVSNRPIAFALTGLLSTTIRSTDVFVLTAFALVLFWWFRKKLWLALPVLYLLVIAFNWSQYGSPAPSLNSGYNIFLGQQELYPIAHPKFDIDVFYMRHGFDDPARLIPDPAKRTELASDKAYRQAGFKSLRASLSRFLSSSILKSTNWLLNIQVVPSAPGSYSLEKEGGQYKIDVDRIPIAGEYREDVVYSLYKIVYNIFFIGALLAAIGSCLAGGRNKLSLLLTPTFVTLPIVALAFPDTRFKIVYEILAIPAICCCAPEFFKMLSIGWRAVYVIRPPGGRDVADPAR